MKFSQSLVFLHLVCLAFARNQPASLATPIYFEPNHGQFAPGVRFAVRGPRSAAWITDGELRIDGARIAFAPAQSAPRQARGVGQQAGVSSYFVGSDAAKWIRNVPSYSQARIEEIYPGVDILFYASGADLEYDLVVKPGADPSRIRIDFDPPPDATGEIRLTSGALRHLVPRVHQAGKAVSWQTRLQGASLRFDIPSYDKSLPLVIDPVLAYSTYVGGGGIASIRAIAADASGAAYLAGSAAGDAFVTKISAEPVQGAHIRLYTVYFGSRTAEDRVAAIAVDRAGAAYIAGATKGADFPLKRAFASTFSGFAGGEDGFIAKIDANPGPDGYDIAMASYLGGPATAIAASAAGVYVAGGTSGSGFASLRAAQLASSGSSGAYAVKLAVNPSNGAYERVYAMLFPGTIAGIAVDSTGAAYIGGRTSSAAFPVLNAFQPTFQMPQQAPLTVEADGFVTKIAASPASNGNYELVYSSYIGGNQSDEVTAIAVDAAGGAHLAGSTYSFDLPLARPLQPEKSLLALHPAGFLAKVSAQPNSAGAHSLDYCSYFGNGRTMAPRSLRLDGSGGVYVAGSTFGPHANPFPYVDPVFRALGANVLGFLGKFRIPEAGAAAVELFTPIGDVNVSDGVVADVDSSGSAYLAGEAWDFNFPALAGAAFPEGGSPRGFALKLSPGAPSTRVTLQSQPAAIRITVSGAGCSPGDHVTPVTLNWTAGLACQVTLPSLEIDAAAKRQILFERWQGGAVTSQRFIGYVLSTIVTPFEAAASYQAIFRAAHALTLSVDNPGRGAVQTEPVYLESGQSSRIAATPSFGYAFVQWTGAPVERYGSAATTVTMGDAPIDLTANFAFVSTGAAASQFVPVSPCRVTDTRVSAGPVPANSTREFSVSGACGVPSGATAYSLNVTVVPRAGLGYLTVFPAGQAQPAVSTLNSLDGRVKANAAIVPAGAGGRVSVYATDQADVILDVNGYFVAPQQGSLAYYPLPPCRIVDTRASTRLAAATSRAIPVLSAGCGVPATARAYALNATVIPAARLGFLRIQPAGSAPANTSTLNAVTGTIVANAAIVPAGANGALDAFATDDTHLILDINGYFAPPGADGGLNFHPLAPCRILDSRSAPSVEMAGSTTTMIGPGFGSCAVPRAARVLSLNATVLPQTPAFGYLTLYPPDLPGGPPIASTLNAIDGALTSNAALIEAAVSQLAAYVSDRAHLILDLNGVFAP